MRPIDISPFVRFLLLPALLIAHYLPVSARTFTPKDTMYVCHSGVASAYAVEDVDSVTFQKPSERIEIIFPAQGDTCASRALAVSFSVSELDLSAGESQDIPYSLTGASSNVVVKAMAQNGWNVKVTESTQTGGTLKVTAPIPITESEILILVNDGYHTVMTSLVHKKPEIQIEIPDFGDIGMIRVVGGTFTMGATSEQGSDATDKERPAHEVTLGGFYIGKFEVTQELWQAVMGNNPSSSFGSGLPVVNVSWNDCQDFIQKLNSLTGKSFRLPTEAEWEYAARGGRRSKGYKYSGSDTIDDVAWYSENSSSKTHQVGTKSPNELGIYDMSGNVFEWCQDRYGSYSAAAQTDPTGPESGSEFVLRGGGYNFVAKSCRCSYRDKYSVGRFFIGLRLVLVE